VLELDGRATVLVGILVYFLGKFLTRQFRFLREYNIPEPVTGGFLVSLLLGAAYFLIDFQVNFDLEPRDDFLLVFFTTIGLTSRFATLLQGGKALAVLLVLAIIYLFLQNITGLSVIGLTNLDAHVGIIGGSVSLSGGHGTAIAWAPTFVEQYGIMNAMEIGIACATFGLVLGGLIGGPIAQFLISHYKLQPSDDEHLTVGFKYEDNKEEINVDNMLIVIFVISITIGIGVYFNDFLESIDIKLPDFVTCLFAGIVITNLIPVIFPWIRNYDPENSPTLSLVSDMSLGLFLVMSLMSMQLWTIVDLAGPIILLLLMQVIVITVFVIFVVFRFMGRDYDAAVISAGYAGLGLGATPTAIANMSAVTKKFGASPKAFIVVPLVGAFFIDISNAMIINQFLAWLN
jgi:ESS family glutamate:Na+ symporter